MRKIIYMDHHATTPVDPRVFEDMRPYFCERYGNPASASHRFGWEAEEAVRQAREQVAGLIGAQASEIVWTSGTTESINLALMGVARRYHDRDRGDHIVTCVTEHRAALEPARFLEKSGLRVTYLSVDGQGRLDVDQVRGALSDKTILISLMAANNEIGTIHPLADIGKMAKERGILFHVDGAQGCGKFAIDVEAMGIDLLSMSAHKVYGPKGIGALYVRARNPRVTLEPLLHGGSQERGLRPGTLAVPNIVGMGRAFEIAGAEMAEEGKRLLRLKKRLWEGLLREIDGVSLNGPVDSRLPGNLNVSFEGVRADALMARLRDVAVSSGSACVSESSSSGSSGSSQLREPSYVLRAMGLSDERARSSIRIGLGRFNTEEEIDRAILSLSATVQSLR